MDLKTFIETIGDAEASRLFSVKPRTIGSWRRAERLPSPRNAIMIERRSSGRVRREEVRPDLFGEAAA